MGDPFHSAVRTLLNLGAFAGDRLITIGMRQHFLKDDPQFRQALKAHPEAVAQSIIWRLHIACWAAKSALGIPGDFIEFGAGDGVTSTMIDAVVDYAAAGKRFYLYDSFSGIPDAFVESSEEINHYRKDNEEQYLKLVRRFQGKKNIQVIKGVVPDILSEQCPEDVAFVHMDLSNFSSERAALMAIYPKLVDGAIVLFQGFAFEYYGIWKLAQDDFVRDNNLHIAELPTGQGLLIIRKR